MSNWGILGSTAIARMPVTQNLQVPYGSQNHALKGNLPRIPNSPSKKLLTIFLKLILFAQHSTKSQRSFILFSYNINFSNLGQRPSNKKIFGLNRHSKNACTQNLQYLYGS